jgi:hypothetical protein
VDFPDTATRVGRVGINADRVPHRFDRVLHGRRKDPRGRHAARHAHRTERRCDGNDGGREPATIARRSAARHRMPFGRVAYRRKVRPLQSSARRRRQRSTKRTEIRAELVRAWIPSARTRDDGVDLFIRELRCVFHHRCDRRPHDLGNGLERQGSLE